METTSMMLVTGANGHVGFNLVKMLLEDGHNNLRVSVRNKGDPAKTAALKALGVKDIVSLDVRDEPTFRKACQGIKFLFHVAATYRLHTGSAKADAELIHHKAVAEQHSLKDGGSSESHSRSDDEIRCPAQ